MKRSWLLLLAIGPMVAWLGCAAPNEGVRVMDRPVAGRAPVYSPENSLVDTYWRLVELNGKPAPLGSGGKEPHLVLQPDKPIARGFGGCNRFSAGYELDGERLGFHRIVATRMACAEGMDLEAEYLAALARVATWSRDGERLILRDADGTVLARFTLRPL